MMNGGDDDDVRLIMAILMSDSIDNDDVMDDDCDGDCNFAWQTGSQSQQTRQRRVHCTSLCSGTWRGACGGVPFKAIRFLRQYKRQRRIGGAYFDVMATATR